MNKPQQRPMLNSCVVISCNMCLPRSLLSGSSADSGRDHHVTQEWPLLATGEKTRMTVWFYFWFDHLVAMYIEVLLHDCAVLS